VGAIGALRRAVTAQRTVALTETGRKSGFSTRDAWQAARFDGGRSVRVKDRVALWQDEAFLEKPCSVRGLMEAVSLLLFGRVDSPQLVR